MAQEERARQTLANIAVVIGDAATGDFMLPVLPQLDAGGIFCSIYVDPARDAAGANSFKKAKVPYTVAESIPAAVQEIARDMTSSSAELP